MEIECSDRLFSVKFLTSSNLKEEESEGRSTRGGAHHAMWRRFSSGLRALVRFVVNSASFFGYSCARRSQHCAEGDRLPPKRQWAGSISHFRSREQLGQVCFVFSNADILCRPVYRARLDMLALFLSIGILHLTPTLTHPFYLS